MTQPTIFVPYAIALLAKQKGFDEPCLAYCCSDVLHYDLGNQADEEDLHLNSRLSSISQAAPTYQQLVDWLREKHNTSVITHPHFIGTSSTEWCGIVHKPGESYTQFPVKYDYYEAFDYTLERVLKEL